MAVKFKSEAQGLDTFSRQWEVQPKPYTHPLPFSFYRRMETQWPFYPQAQSNPGKQVNDAAYSSTNPGSYVDTKKLDAALFGARNAAVAKMKGDAQAQLGLMIAQWEETAGLLQSAHKNLTVPVPDAKAHEMRWKFRDKIIKRLYKRGSVSNYYLMTIFGIIPTAADLRQAALVLSKPFPAKKTSVMRSVTDAKVDSGGSYRGTLYSEYGARVGGAVRVTNPKLSFANDLGLINPLSIAWDSIPFSFLVNMVCPVGAFLNCLTDLVGYEVIDGYYTTFVKKTWHGEVFGQPAAGANNVWRSRMVRQISVKRNLGVPDPRLPPVRCPEPTLFNTTMALSLLDQKLGFIDEIVGELTAEYPGRIGGPRVPGSRVK